jgi:hypothetical protein
MLINCYFILIKLLFRNYKSIKIPYDNFLFGGSEKKAQRYADELIKLSPVDGYLSKAHIDEYFEHRNCEHIWGDSDGDGFEECQTCGLLRNQIEE